MESIEQEKNKKRALGRGLASLIPAIDEPFDSSKKEFFLCDIEKLVPNTYQPRKIFSQESLDELVESIRVHGIIQPLIVRRRDGNYEIIAGERRWRAAVRAGLTQVPVVVKDVEGDSPSLEMAIIENVQREDLNCIEEAIAYQQLIDEFKLSQEDIAQRVGKNRATIANILRLLKLPVQIREDITNGKLTMGHARALLSLESTEEQLKLRELIIKKTLSVRETERKVNEILKREKVDKSQETFSVDPNIIALEEDLKRKYETVVKINGTENKGMIQFIYSSRDELMRLADRLVGEKIAETN